MKNRLTTRYFPALFRINDYPIFQIVLLFVFIASGVSASDHSSSKSWNFEGNIQLGIVAKGTNDRLDTDGAPVLGPDPKQARVLSRQVEPSIFFNLQLRSPSGITTYLKTPMEESGLMAGLLIPSVWGEWDVQGFCGMDESVWQDPYAVDIVRKETDLLSYGGRVGLDHILGSNFNLGYDFRVMDVDDDVIARSEPTLARGGVEHRFELGWTHQLATSSLKPKLQLVIGDLEGEASSYESVAVKLEWLFPWRNYLLMVSGATALEGHEGDHPLFGEQQVDLQLEAGALLLYLEPFGLKDWNVGVLTAWQERESTCDFYDSSTWYAGTLLGYSF